MAIILVLKVKEWQNAIKNGLNDYQEAVNYFEDNRKKGIHVISLRAY